MRQVYQNSYIANYHSVGNTATQLEPAIGPQRRDKRKRKNKKNIQPGIYVSITYLIFISFSLILVLILCVDYMRCNSQIIAASTEIKELEQQLFELKQKNDSELAYIEGNINLLEIKEYAINELGMVYPQKGQIYYYKDDKTSYVTQFSPIKK